MLGRRFLVAASLLLVVGCSSGGSPGATTQITQCEIGDLGPRGSVEPPTLGSGKLIVKGTVTNLTKQVASYSIRVIAYDGTFPVGALDPPATAGLVRPGETANFGGVGLVDHQQHVPQFPTCKVTISAE